VGVLTGKNSHGVTSSRAPVAVDGRLGFFDWSEALGRAGLRGGRGGAFGGVGAGSGLEKVLVE